MTIPHLPELTFAYGSNTNIPDLLAWCERHGFADAGFEVAGVADLPDVELAFNRYSEGRGGGVLSLKRRVGNLVRGVLVRPNASGWRALDRKEGIASGAYEREVRHAFDDAGSVIPVAVYIAYPEREIHFTPSANYLDVVKAGYAAAGLNDEDVLRAAQGEAASDPCSGVFVYGTLMRDEPLFSEIVAASPTCILLARCRGQLFDLGPFPGLRLNGYQQQTEVEGEFVRFDDLSAALSRLDVVEGALPYCAPGGLYQRRLTWCDVGDGRARPVWTYEVNVMHAVNDVASGCWRRHTGRRREVISKIVAWHALGHSDFPVRLANVTASRFRPDSPPDFDLTIPAISDAIDANVVSERSLARVSGKWAVPLSSPLDSVPPKRARGRKRVTPTPAETAERKRRWWGPERNERRRQRYATDESYRQAAIAQVASSYRKKREATGRSPQRRDTQKHLAEIETFASRRFMSGASEQAALTLTVEELARFLDRHPQVVRRWISKGLIPPPVATALNSRNRLQRVYTLREAAVIGEAIADHESRSSYLRCDHSHVLDLISTRLKEEGG
jgi:gamma-glutamylcyclotransferase (GGCT)/AIG2-like uncharacterized protein YtfP